MCVSVSRTCGISFMKQQFVITHTICHTAIAALLDGSVTNKHTFCQNVATKKSLSLYFRKNVTCLSFGLLRVCQFFLSSVKLYIVVLQQIAVSRAM
jgi:hypothetical protein